jgi:large subunit ribosomal protein L19
MADPSGNLTAVIELRVLKEIHETSGGPVLGRGTAKNNAPQPGMNNGARTHGTGLLGNVQITIGEAPLPQGGLCLGDGQHLSVGRGVLELLDLIAGPCQNAAFAHHHRPNWNFLLPAGRLGLPQSFAHEIVVALKVDNRIHGVGSAAQSGILFAFPHKSELNPCPFEENLTGGSLMSAIIAKINQEQMKSEVTPFNVGDAVRVHTRVVEGDKERIQIYSGIVIGRKGTLMNQTLTVRRISYGEGVERVFPIHSPRVAKIEVETAGTARRSKLTYLRKRKGKSAMAVREKARV